MTRRSFSQVLILALLAGWFAPRVWAAQQEGGLSAERVAAQRDQDADAEEAAYAAELAEQKKNRELDYELMNRLVEVMSQVEEHYVKDIDREELLKAAIDGVLKKLDPHSSYVAPEDVAEFEEDIHQRIEGGIGIIVNSRDGRLEVVSPIVGGPAYKAGVIAGDRIIKIEGENTAGWNVEQAAGKLKGKPGSKVTFTVIHPGKRDEVTLSVKREVVRVETVLGDKRKLDDSWDFMIDHERRIGYIRLTAFSQETAGELRRALAELKAQNLQGLVLDLRFNPGGLLTSAVEISDLFIPEGDIVSTEERGQDRVTRKAKKPGTYEGFPMAILVNRFSASASEIVSACLQDHERAIVVGERTFGKGSVQNIIQLAGGGQLKLTTAGYFRPSGKNIHRKPEDKETDDWGVRPDKDYELKLSDEDTFRLITTRRDRDVVLPHGDADDAGESENPSGGEPYDAPATDAAVPASPHPPAPGDFVDEQLELALKYLAGEMAKK